MKKIITLGIFVIIFVMASYVLAAASFSVTLTPDKTTVAPATEVTISVFLDNIKEAGSGLNTFMGTLEYDKTAIEDIETTSFTTQNGWVLQSFNKDNGKFVMSKDSFATAKEEIIKIKVKIKSTAVEGNTIINIKDCSSTTDTEDVVAQNPATATLTIKKTTTIPDSNTTNITTPNSTNTTTNPIGNTITTPNKNTANTANTTANTNIPKTGIDTTIAIIITILLVNIVIVAVRARKIK